MPLLILHLLLWVIHPFGVCWILSWLFRRRMDSLWWMCSRSFRLYVQIWRVFNGLLHHLLLMMSLDYPLAIRHKKGEYILMEIGGDFEFLELWSFRLYLGASWCIYFLAHDVFILMYLFLCDVYVKGIYYFLFFCFLLHIVLHWLLIYIMRLLMIYVFYFMFCEIKNLFCFTCIFHACINVFIEVFQGLYKLI